MADRIPKTYTFEEQYKPQFESLVRERNYNNIILSVPSNAKEAICFLIKRGFNANGVILVISPYKKRINYEVQYLKDLGLTATTIIEDTSIPDRDDIYATFSEEFFYCTPEMIENGFREVRSFINYLLDSKICTVIFEEAELITYTRRTSFQFLRNVRERYPNVQWIALTDASVQGIEHIASSLSMENYEIIEME
ncbi:hypothetical protein ACKWTF_000527 [Chironomus riparius]